MENETEKELNQKKIDFMANIFFYEEPKKKMLKSYLMFLVFTILSWVVYLFGSEVLSFVLGLIALFSIIKAIESYREI